jgi:hypothetical protein
LDNQKKIVNIILMSSDWVFSHRKNLIRTVASLIGEVVAVQLPLSLTVNLLVKFRQKFIGYFKGDYKPQKTEPGIFTFTPVIIFHPNLWRKSRIFAYMDSYLIGIQLNRFIKKNFNSSIKIFWVYSPHNYLLLNRINYDKLVYDCCDDLEYDYSGNRIENNRLLNEKLVPVCDAVFTVSDFTKNRFLPLNKKTFRHHNGYNPEVFNLKNRFQPVEIDNLDKPVLGYHGPIRDLIDDKLIVRILKETEYYVVFVGYVDRSGLDLYSQFKKYRRFIHIDYIPSHLISSYVNKFDVGIIPLKINDFLLGAFPNKFFEFMALHKPIVTTAVPELFHYRDIIGFSETHDDFIRNCNDSIMKNRTVNVKEYNDILKKNSWSNIVTEMKNELGLS